MALVIDTGVLYAYLDSSDSAHKKCKALINGSEEQLVIPELTLPEVDYWISERLHAEVMVALLEDIQRGAFTLDRTTPADYTRISELIDTYSDSDIGIVDASVLATVERLNEQKLATIDHRHFGLMRPYHTAALELVPSET